MTAKTYHNVRAALIRQRKGIAGSSKNAAALIEGLGLQDILVDSNGKKAHVRVKSQHVAVSGRKITKSATSK